MADLQEPGQPVHVNESKLNTDLLYRFNYVASFIGFTEADIAAIHAIEPLFSPLIPKLVDAVYDKLFGFDVTKKIFLKRNEGFNGALAVDLDNLDTRHDQIKMRKDMLSKYMAKLLTADYDESFIKYLDWVGKIHTLHSSKKSKILVDYVHLNALMGWLQSEIFSAIYSFGMERNKEIETILAFTKILWIQNDLFARWYTELQSPMAQQQSTI